MGKHDTLAKVLAIIGTVLVAFPLVVPLVFSLRSIGRPGGFRLDYLMPFEIYPVALVGVALLLWAVLRARLRKKAAGIAIGCMLGFFILCAISAQVTGIAQSEEQLETWRYVLTAGLGGAALLAQIGLIVVGGVLIRDLSAAPS